MNQKEINEKVANDEKLGRELFEQVCKRESWCKPHKFSKKKHAKWDVSFYFKPQFSTEIPIIADIKKRRYTTSTFNDWYFEVDKAEALIKLANESNKDAKIGYIHLFEDNLIWLWIFTKEQIQQMESKMIQMQKNDWSDEKEWKKVYCLTPAQAIKKEEIDLNKSIFNK